MRRATVLSTCALIVVLLCSVIVAAQAPPPPPPPPPPPLFHADGLMPHGPKVSHAIVSVQKYLELSDAQVQQWKDLQASRQQKVDEVKGQIRELEDQLESQLMATNPSASAVGELMIQLRSLRQERTKAWQSTAEAVRQILTPAQVEKLNAADKASELRPVIEALVGAGFLAPPPPPPPPPFSHAEGKVVKHSAQAPKVQIRHQK